MAKQGNLVFLYEALNCKLNLALDTGTAGIALASKGKHSTSLLKGSTHWIYFYSFSHKYLS